MTLHVFVFGGYRSQCLAQITDIFCEIKGIILVTRAVVTVCLDWKGADCPTRLNSDVDLLIFDTKTGCQGLETPGRGFEDLPLSLNNSLLSSWPYFGIQCHTMSF